MTSFHYFPRKLTIDAHADVYTPAFAIAVAHARGFSSAVSHLVLPSVQKEKFPLGDWGWERGDGGIRLPTLSGSLRVSQLVVEIASCLVRAMPTFFRFPKPTSVPFLKLFSKKFCFLFSYFYD